jgi:hypothetical protein
VHLGRTAATCCSGNPLWLWIPGSHGELFEELSEPEEGMTRIPKVGQGDGGAKKKELEFFLLKL